MDPRRITPSRESYWQRLFNDYALQYGQDHCISGWSRDGLEVRQGMYLNALKADGQIVFNP